MKTVKINVIKYLNLMFHAPSPLISLKPSSIVEELTRKKVTTEENEANGGAEWVNWWL